MSTRLRRRPLTELLLDTLRAGNGKPVGDGEAPHNAGWSDDPDSPAAVFTPYVVLAALPGSRSQGTFADPQDTWLVPYKLVAVGVSREQCDWMADKALDDLDGLEQTRVLDGAWKVMQLQLQVLDGPARIDQSEPPYWQRGDTLTVWLTKELV